MSSLFPLFDRLVSGKREYRILMLGLDAAGKSWVGFVLFCFVCGFFAGWFDIAWR